MIVFEAVGQFLTKLNKTYISIDLIKTIVQKLLSINQNLI